MAAAWCGRGLLRGPRLCASSRRYGYIVLVPEIGEGIPEGEHLLLNKDGLPEFNAFTIEKCIASISKESITFEDGIRNIEKAKNENIFTDIFTPLERLESPLELTWGLAKTLYLGNSSIMPTTSYMKIHERAHRARYTKFNNPTIYEATLKAKKNASSYTDEENRLINKHYLEGRLNGLELNTKKRDKLHSVLGELYKEQNEYRDKNAIALKQFTHTITDSQLIGNFPPNLLKNMSNNKSEPTRGPWQITHQPSVYHGFMEHCPDKMLRYNAWQAYTKVASLHGDKSINTSVNLEKIRQFQRDKAQLLGFATYADLSMETKMAGSVDNVNNMITTLLDRAKLMQDLELEKLEDFAKERGLDSNLEECDIAYWKREQKKELFSYDEENLREYFPLPVVVEGLFDLCSKLFGINIVERPKANVWHEDVKFYDVFDASSSVPIAGFYFDPYTREQQKARQHEELGWCLPIRHHSGLNGVQPLTALIFNVDIPMYGKPSLLSFHEVKYLFHKFGQCMNNLLCKTTYSDVSGSLEWDVSQVAGHVLTHWLYDPSVINSISSHYTTQEPLSTEMISKLDDVRKHMAGYDLSQELFLSSLDIKLYSTGDFWRNILIDLWPKYNTLPFNKFNSIPCSFTKIFSGQWAAAYYSDVWSRLIAADIYSAFYEVLHDEGKIEEVGKRYRDTFLATGGGCHPNEVFRRFRGRDPSHKALLHVLGLKKPIVSEQKH